MCDCIGTLEVANIKLLTILFEMPGKNCIYFAPFVCLSVFPMSVHLYDDQYDCISII